MAEGATKELPGAAAETPEAARAPTPPLSPAAVYGAAVHLLGRSPAHRGLPIAAIDPLIAAPLKLGQFKLYRRQGQPFAFAAWAYVTEVVEARLRAGGSLTPEEWRCGERPFVVAVVAPFGGAERLRADLKSTLFTNAEYREWAPPHGDGDGPITRSSADPAVSYRRATREDVTALAPRLRAADLAEIKAVSGLDGEAALAAGVANSKQC